MGARILSCADYFDKKRFEDGLSEAAALSSVAELSGTAFFGESVEALRAVLLSKAKAGSVQVVSVVEVPTSKLLPGMVLAGDLCSKGGVLMLASSHVLDAGLIRQIRDFEVKNGHFNNIRVTTTKDAKSHADD